MIADYVGDDPTQKFLLNAGTNLGTGSRPPEAAKDDVWPGYRSVFIRRHPHADVGDGAVPNREALVGRFGESCGSIVMDLISSACVYLSIE